MPCDLEREGGILREQTVQTLHRPRCPHPANDHLRTGRAEKRDERLRRLGGSEQSLVSHKVAYDHLRLLAGRIEAAANEVFENGDVEKQSAQMTLAFADFEQSMLREKRSIIET